MVRARGLELAVYTTPEVPGAVPLLCVNGGLLFDHKLLWPALSPLASRRQLILYDQRGRGRSQPPPGASSARIEHDAGDIPALRAALGLRQWDLLGHSWGGGIALLGAEQDREGTRRIVTVDAVGATSAWMDALDRDAARRLDAAGRAALARVDGAALDAGDAGAHSAHSRALYPAWFADAELARLFSPPRATSVTGASVAGRLRRDGYDWRPLLRALDRPTLVIHGERDLLPPAVARETAALLPRATLALIPGSGHMPFWEAPEQLFALCESFLSAPP
jgi:proline iminopeptidase